MYPIGVDSEGVGGMGSGCWDSMSRPIGLSVRACLGSSGQCSISISVPTPSGFTAFEQTFLPNALSHNLVYVGLLL